MENWRLIEEATNYEVSDLGRVRNFKTGKILTPRFLKSGYAQVCIRIIKTNKFQNRYIHRLVAQAFLPNPNHYEQVNHIDGNVHNNKLQNLEWCNNSQNQIHRYNILGKKRSSQRRIGQFDTQGRLIQEFDSILDAVHAMDRTARASIDQVLQGRHKLAYGFSWRYLDKEIVQ